MQGGEQALKLDVQRVGAADIAGAARSGGAVVNRLVGTRDNRRMVYRE